MSLVEVTAAQGDVGQIDLTFATNFANDLLKTLHAAEYLGREADLVCEKLNKTP